MGGGRVRGGVGDVGGARGDRARWGCVFLECVDIEHAKQECLSIVYYKCNIRS